MADNLYFLLFITVWCAVVAFGVVFQNFRVRSSVGVEHWTALVLIALVYFAWILVRWRWPAVEGLSGFITIILVSFISGFREATTSLRRFLKRRDLNS